MGMFRGNGGGGITGTVASITFEAKEWKSKGKEAYSTLSAKIVLTIDGAAKGAKGVERFIRAGFFYPDNQSISKDGTTLSNGDKGGPVIQADTDFARLIGTLLDKGFPEDRLDPDGLNFSGVVGTRLTLANQRDEEATKKFGKRKGADGKEYDRDYPVITAVLALPTGKAPAAGKASAKAGAKAEANGNVELTDATLVALIGKAKKGKLDRGSLKSTLVAFQMDSDDMTKAQRDAVYALADDDDYIADAVKREVFAYDAEEEVFSAA